jgi:hypothetical protein
MPRSRMEHHTLIGGKLHVYKRPGSNYWQCSAFLAGKNWRTSTKEDSLAHAKEFAEDWYLGLRGKHRAGELKTGKTFRTAAEQFVREYEVHHPGPEKPQICQRSRRQAARSPTSIFWDEGAFGNHTWHGSGVSYPSNNLAHGSKNRGIAAPGAQHNASGDCRTETGVEGSAATWLGGIYPRSLAPI